MAGQLENYEYDVFVSHASEDKDDFVRPLVKALEREGLRVWYDETALLVGDSLLSAIDSGVKKSRYGVVVLSQASFRKKWTQNERDAMGSAARNRIEQHFQMTKILDIWEELYLELLERNAAPKP